MKNEFGTLKSVCFSGHRIVPFAKQNEIMRLTSSLRNIEDLLAAEEMLTDYLADMS